MHYRVLAEAYLYAAIVNPRGTVRKAIQAEWPLFRDRSLRLPSEGEIFSGRFACRFPVVISACGADITCGRRNHYLTLGFDITTPSMWDIISQVVSEGPSGGLAPPPNQCVRRLLRTIQDALKTTLRTWTGRRNVRKKFRLPLRRS